MKNFFPALASIIVLSFFLGQGAGAATVKAPSLLEAKETYQAGRVLEVRGLAPANTDILVYINLQVAGIAKTKSENQSLSSFFFSLNKDLPAGQYEVAAVARDKASFVVSDFSQRQVVTESRPAISVKPAPKVFPPTLLRSVVDAESAYNRPKIIGQALAGQRIEVYINDMRDGQIILDETRPGTMQFLYIPAAELPAGQHKVYLYAFDRDNNKSEQSNLIYINVSGATEGKIESGATENQAENVTGKTETKEGEIIGTAATSSLEQILNYTPATTSFEASGSIDEDKTRQSRVRTNLLVFILFLIAIIIWIIWVNRELIKEKKEKAEPEASDDPDVRNF